MEVWSSCWICCRCWICPCVFQLPSENFFFSFFSNSAVQDPWGRIHVTGINWCSLVFRGHQFSGGRWWPGLVWPNKWTRYSYVSTAGSRYLRLEFNEVLYLFRKHDLISLQSNACSQDPLGRASKHLDSWVLTDFAKGGRNHSWLRPRGTQ